MPMLADVDDPPPSRVKGFLIGTAVALPVGAAFLWFALTVLPGLILENAEDFDERLRQEDAYMKAVCADLDLARDESLCECALAVEYPSLDCRLPFMHWSLERMVEQCSDEATYESALSFCSCVRALDEQLAGLEPDTKEARQTVGRYAKCTELDDALFLPPVSELPPSSPEEAAAAAAANQDQP